MPDWKTDEELYDIANRLGRKIISVALDPDRGIYIAGFSQAPGMDWCAKSVAAAEFIIQNLGG